jgi:hypothetical protein
MEIDLTNRLAISLLIPSPWLKSTTLVKRSHRKLPSRGLFELLCLS